MSLLFRSLFLFICVYYTRVYYLPISAIIITIIGRGRCPYFIFFIFFLNHCFYRLTGRKTPSYLLTLLLFIHLHWAIFVPFIDHFLLFFSPLFFLLPRIDGCYVKVLLYVHRNRRLIRDGQNRWIGNSLSCICAAIQSMVGNLLSCICAAMV